MNEIKRIVQISVIDGGDLIGLANNGEVYICCNRYSEGYTCWELLLEKDLPIMEKNNE